MRLKKEVERIQKHLIGDAPRLEDASALEEMLKVALPALEDTINRYPAKQQEKVWSLYLEEVRRLAFGFHLAIVEDKHRQEFVKTGNQAIMLHAEKSVKHIFRLYGFLYPETVD